jgi:hypothetical protein
MKAKDTMALMALMMASGMDVEPILDRPKPQRRTAEELAEHKGLKAFYYGDECIYALNKKNADRKARRLNLI